MDDSQSVGARIADLRVRRGWTQQHLADAAGYSLSYMKKLELGYRSPTSANVAVLAHTLGVDPASLWGQPFDRDRESLVQALRAQLLVHGLPPAGTLAGTVSHVDMLEAGVREVEADRDLADLTAVAAAVPPLLSMLRELTPAMPPALAADYYSRLYDAAAKAAHALGYPAVAQHAARLMTESAMRSGDPGRQVVGLSLHASWLQREGLFGDAAQVMTSAFDVLSPVPLETPRLLSAAGFCHLQMAMVLIRQKASEEGWREYRLAQEIAGRLGADRNDYARSFGPTNVAIWGPALALEEYDDGRALNLAARVNIPAGFSRTRAGQHWVDAARAHAGVGRPAAALDALLEARTVAPQQTRYHPHVHETLQALARAERRRPQTLRAYSTWAGLPD
jgi:transcriptional regulator with XRE-family HTH domain